MATRRNVALRLLAGACISALTSAAYGQVPATPVSSGHERAVAEFQQARRLIDGGDCASALPHLETSIAQESSIGGRLSIAECVEKTDPLRGWHALSDASVLAYTTGDDRLSFIEARLGQLDRLVPLLLVTVRKDDLDRAGLEVSIDGSPMDRFHLRRGIAVEAGPHVVEVRAPGKAVWSSRAIAPAAGAVTRLSVELANAAPELAAPPPSTRPAATPMPEPTDPRAPRRTVGLVLVATGVSAVAVGAVFGVLALDKAGELDVACGGSRKSCSGRPELVAPLRDNGSTLASVSTVSFIAGGTMLAGGLALYFWPRGTSSGTGAAGMRLVPVIGATQGMSLTGAF